MMESNKTVRVSKLDGFRGLLSLIVCLNHSFLVVAIPTYADIWHQNLLAVTNIQSKLQQLLMLLGNGGFAVTLFFLLSGFVLGQSFTRINLTWVSILTFYLKRLIRLYPVYLFLILLTTIYMVSGFVRQDFPSSSPWFNWWMNFQMTPSEFFRNALFVHTYLGGVTWTLRVILIASFLFPLFYHIHRYTSKMIDILIVALLIIASFTIFDLPGFRDLRYLYMFYLGLIIPRFQTLFSSLSRYHLIIIVPLLTFIALATRYQTDEYVGGVVEAFTSFGLIGLSVYGQSNPLLDSLDSSWLQFFGKISYSLYLVHFSVLYLIARAMFTYLPQLPYTESYFLIHTSLFVVSTIIATIVAWFVYRFIERPSQSLANKTNYLFKQP